ncbi:sterol desaturase family protein [Terricaulis silvestris]|uniref:Fatty acid hydroxylase superfamily protein n=1 Tax=Terricaulis silvestris TaxID=2686094 RepID=A0A6I6MMQ4_9CAUL|nr:sterol desaturase family protein [Terricaulis silvestris]QGZ94007.1 Fatty acid hydroxylase superfamily protein [Terricaulis silvestris]
MPTLIPEAAEHWLKFIQTDLTRYAIFAIGVWLVLWVVLAAVLRGRKIRDTRPPARQMVTEFAVSLRSVAIFSTIGLIPWLLERAGWLHGSEIASQWGPVWFWACLALMVVAHDTFFYWVHRLMHRPQLFRTWHRRHHKSHNPSPFTAYSFDLGEAAVMGVFVPIWVVAVPTPWTVVGLFMLHQIVRNTLGHSGYELMPARSDGRPMFDWLTTTTHHDLHHAQGYNYGLYFTFWDRLMGTEHPEYHARFAAAVRKPLLPRAEAASPAAIVVTIALAALLLPVSRANADTPASLAGDWATPGLGAVISLAPCRENSDALCGRLIWSWDPERVRPGSIGAIDAVWRDGAFRDGELVNPEDGRTYRGRITPDGADILRLQGCAGPFCQTQTWRRLESIRRPRP